MRLFASDRIAYTCSILTLRNPERYDSKNKERVGFRPAIKAPRPRGRFAKPRD